MAKRQKKTAKTKKENPNSFFKNKQTHLGFGVFFVLFSFWLFGAFYSFFSHWSQDQSQLADFTNRTIHTKNSLSKIGASISDFFIYKGFGVSTFILPLLIFLSGIYLIIDIPLKKIRKTAFWSLLLMIWFSVLLAVLKLKNTLLSGIVGFEVNDFLQIYIGKIGIILLLVLTALLYLIYKLKWQPKAIKISKAKIEDDELSINKNQTVETKANERVYDTTTNMDTEKSNIIDTNDINLNITSTIKKSTPSEDDFIVQVPEPEEEIKIEIKTPVNEENLVENLSNKLIEDFGEFDPTLELSDFKFPTLDLLKDYGPEQIKINKEELEANKNKIVQTLNDYKIGIKSIKAMVGPTITLYEIIPEAGVRISKIKNLEDDIALSLSALGIRIIAPMPGKGTIGIEVPNKNSTIVSMRSAIASTKFQNSKMELPIAFGKTISNETFVADLAKMPHLLMAGATGQGKSVGLNAVLTSLLYKKHPAEIKFILIDPKKVELTLFNKIERHYLAKLPDAEEAIITDTAKVVNTLNSLCIEMDDRYDLLKNAFVRNIKEYNTKFKARKLNPENGHRFLPYIVLVIDEFADLIMTAGKEVETPIARLAQLARAIGIHLIVATQRPSVNVITGIIKANFPARAAFRVTSKIDSRTILDASGADQLIGRGDMLVSTGNEIIRIQCAFVDTPEVERITEFIGSQRAYNSAYLLPEYVSDESGTSIDVDIADRDKLFEEAAYVIVNAQQGSASLIQRKLKLGYNRAGRIIDQLEAAGIVGQFQGSKAREVLVAD
ncbi:MAG TPA: DNA translocase FtsK, partial [Flavobacteriaceae bacterium]|nr:DNA translocase FtsK [Flavobacteriaceae bacterium]